MHYNPYYSNIHTWTDDAPAAKTFINLGAKGKTMKALYKKYSSLSRKCHRTFALLEASGYFQLPEITQLNAEQQAARDAYRAARKEDSAFTETLDKWTLVKIGLALHGSHGYIRPINQSVIEHLKKRQKERETEEWVNQFIL